MDIRKSECLTTPIYRIYVIAVLFGLQCIQFARQSRKGTEYKKYDEPATSTVDNRLTNPR